MITNANSGTRIDEVSEGIYRINTPVEIPSLPGGFNFNQYLVVDEEPLLFHAGLRRMFPLVAEAISKVIPLKTLRYVGFSHFEADEFGGMNDFLAACPQALPVSSRIGALTSVNDMADRPAHALADEEILVLGKHRLRWLDTPHLPHGWDCGIMFDETTRTLLCGDLFTQGGTNTPAVTESDILQPSEQFRKPLDYFAHSWNSKSQLARLAKLKPKTLACMHGSAFCGDGAQLLLDLAGVLKPETL